MIAKSLKVVLQQAGWFLKALIYRMLKAVGAITHLAGYVVGSPLLRVIGALENGSNVGLIGETNCSNCLHLELVEGKITIKKDAYSVDLPLQLMVFHNA